MTISSELLCSYADGELDAETARMVEAQIAGNPQLQADLTAHRALRARLAAHFAPIAEQSVPERLRQALMGDGDEPQVFDFAAEARKRRAPVRPMRWQRIAGPALAATLVLGVIGYGLRSPNDNFARGDLAKALDGQLIATQTPDTPVRILLTIRDEQGRYCRGFTGQAGSGLACRDGSDWRLVKTFGGANPTSTEYRQAGNGDSAVMAAMQDIAAGPALDATEEALAARQGWQASHAP